VDVCQAVAYAHARGVLHRDLKPDNVMLGKYGETLVVDWGLAKPLGRRGEAGGEATLRPRTGAEATATAAGGPLGTPAYMSPEQAEGRLDDLGPATDVYGLGATLYELLTGRLPFEGKYRELVVEDVRAGRFPPPRAVTPAVPAALEAVCLRAMALRPEVRYATVLELAAEVECWLAGEPVAAYPEPWPDRARRWARRHRPLVTGAAAALLVGVVSLGAAAALLAAANERERYARGEAERERDAAQAQKQRTRAALDAMTSQVTDDWLATQPKLLPQQREFLQSALRYYQEFAREAATDEAGRVLVAEAHHRVGRMLEQLGRYAEAEEVIGRQVGLRERLAADSPTSPVHRDGLARSLNLHGAVLENLGRLEPAEAALRRAVALFEALPADGPDISDVPVKLRASLHNLGGVLVRRGNAPEAVPFLCRAVEVCQSLVRSDGTPAKPEHSVILAESLNSLGVCLDRAGKPDEAEATLRQSMSVGERLVADYPSVARYRWALSLSYHNLGVLKEGLGDVAGADTAYRRCSELQERLVADYPGVAKYRESLAKSYIMRGRLMTTAGKAREMVAAQRRAIEHYERLVADAPSAREYRHDLAVSLNYLAAMLHQLNRGEEARAAARRAAGVYEGLVNDFPTVPEYAIRLAETFAALGNLSGQAGESLGWYAKGIGTLESVLARHPGHQAAQYALGSAHQYRAQALGKFGRHAEALRDWDRAVALGEPSAQAERRLARADALARAGEPARAVADAEALAGARDAPAGTLYDAACVYALASAAPPAGAALADRYAARAVELLRQSFVKGHTDVAHMLQDADLDPLRRRADYAALTWDLADWPAARPAPAATP
jgi:serine/threonine-protein kinase